MQVRNKVIKIFERFFNLPKKGSNINISQKNLPQWDSLNHLPLIFTLEEEFNINFDDNDIFQLTDLKKIISIIESKYKKDD